MSHCVLLVLPNKNTRVSSAQCRAVEIDWKVVSTFHRIPDELSSPHKSYCCNCVGIAVHGWGGKCSGCWIGGKYTRGVALSRCGDRVLKTCQVIIHIGPYSLFVLPNVLGASNLHAAHDSPTM